MSATLAKAVLSISVDLDHDLAAPSIARRRSAEAIVDRLLEMFADHQIPATWAVAESTASPAVGRVASHDVGHEIALLGDSSWVGPKVPRAAFDHELGRRVAAAATRGFSISTLVVGIDHLDQQCDLAIKHGIVAVRHTAPQAAGQSHCRMQPGTLRFGLWSFPVRCGLPGASRWLPGGGGRRAVRSLVDRAIDEGGLVPLAIDARDLAARGRAAGRVLDRVLTHAERRRSQGVLDIATIGAVAAGLLTRYESTPSRSILRPAA